MSDKTVMVSVKGLTKRYGKVRALDGLTFTLGAGEIVALLGPNGAGKTTTFKCLLGVTGFDGSVEVNGVSAAKRGKEVRRQIGYLPQTPAFDSGDTCEEVLQFLADVKGSDPVRAGELLQQVHLTEQRGVEAGRLSGGMRQRLALAAALLSDPPLLLLDEPTANLDAENRREFLDLIVELRNEGRTVILSTHFVDRLGEIADRVIVLQQGRLALDATMEELRRAKQPGRWYTVNVNGTEPDVLLDALKGIGIGAERVTPVKTHFEDMLAAALAAGSQEEEEPK
ncbi:MAG: ABC transporter ATP-binding protein [Dehalococcoidia bacterium]|nr:ABC transporter ATP-binding protein [Dehalococcoidia bacterium]